MWSATFKIHQKSFQNPPKTLSQSTFEKRRVQNARQNPISGHLGRFLVDFWRGLEPQDLLKWHQNREKTLKIRCQKKTWFRTRFFIDFSWLWPPKMQPKLINFLRFFENVDFVKIVLPSRRNCYFSGLDPPKIDQKSMLKSRSKKASRKTSQK